ncbi:MAG: PD-(D/E)XK nuclease-like domain-containing protein [Burkholderiales bacterium]|jgi:hypothetical protein|nr:PD-(D/E)XK nuclease-like domain-containing protein [Burkholderiales bacterium]
MNPNPARRLAAARRRSNFFLGPPLPRALADEAGADPLAAMVALYGNRALAADAMSPMRDDCCARREPIASYLANTTHVSASTLRRVARGEPAAEAALRRHWPAGPGDAFHAFLLEPRRFEREYFRPRTASGRGVEAIGERIWMSEREYAALERMRDAVLGYRGLPLARWLGEGAHELSIYWTDANDGRWKARPDCFTEDVILELKTAADVRATRFARTRSRFGYDLQAAHYVEAVGRLAGRAPRFIYVAVEPAAPHYVWTHELSAVELAEARAALLRARAALRLEAEDARRG